MKGVGDTWLGEAADKETENHTEAFPSLPTKLLPQFALRTEVACGVND